LLAGLLVYGFAITAPAAGYGGDEKDFHLSVDDSVVLAGESIIGIAEAIGEGAENASINVTSNPDVGSKAGTEFVNFIFPTSEDDAGTVTISGDAGEFGSDSKEVEVVDISITTTGTLEVIQELPGQIELTAELSSDAGNYTIRWEITGDGSDIVTNPAPATQAGNQSTVTIKLDSSELGWSTWTDDQSITVRAYVEENPTVDDETTVWLRKFERDFLTSPGSNSVEVPIILDDSDGGNDIGHYLTGSGPFSGPTRILTAVGDDIDPAAVTKKTPTHDASATWNIYYDSNWDRGRGTYSVQETVEFEGGGHVESDYVGIIPGGSYGCGVAVTAGVDNASVNLSDNVVGIHYSGYPPSVTIGITAQGRSVGGSFAVTLTLSSQNSEFENMQTSGSYVITENDVNHPATQNIDLAYVINMASGASLEVIDDNDWTVGGVSSLEGEVPFAPYIEFKPEI